MSNQELDDLIAEALARVKSGDAGITWRAPSVTEPATLARLIDHTLLKPDAGEEQIRSVCAEALVHTFASVCVNATWVPLVTELLTDSTVRPCCTIGFPLGATLPAVKAYEVEQVAQLGAQEVDMVISVGRLCDGDYQAVFRDITAVVDAARDNGLLLKVIIETGLLTGAQKVAACVIAQAAGADFVKTSTGFNGGGATVEDIALMRRVVGSSMGVKASGGVRTADDALHMIAAGATRIGTSGGVRIVEEFAGRSVAATNAPTGGAY